MLVDERLERAAAALVAMGISRTRGIEADCSLFLLSCRHLLGLDEEENWVGIDETADQPCGRDAIHTGAAPGYPLHGSPPQTCAPPRPRRGSPPAPAARLTTGCGTCRA